MVPRTSTPPGLFWAPFSLVEDAGGVLRRLIPPGTHVIEGMKLGDIDPRGRREYCDTISDQARAIASAVLEAILRSHNRPGDVERSARI